MSLVDIRVPDVNGQLESVDVPRFNEIKVFWFPVEPGGRDSILGEYTTSLCVGGNVNPKSGKFISVDIPKTDP
jgi:hypothetical protein